MPAALLKEKAGSLGRDEREGGEGMGIHLAAVHI